MASGLQTLENADNQRLGMIKSAKIMWLVMGGGGGVVVTGIAAVIARAKGL
jgi:hypothetical protein